MQRSEFDVKHDPGACVDVKRYDGVQALEQYHWTKEKNESGIAKTFRYTEQSCSG